MIGDYSDESLELDTELVRRNELDWGLEPELELEEESGDQECPECGDADGTEYDDATERWSCVDCGWISPDLWAPDADGMVRFIIRPKP